MLRSRLRRSNEQLKPVNSYQNEGASPFCVDWIHDIAAEPYYVGEEVRLLSDRL